ncbi:MAG: imidazole glycerol phosphate synthase subunit HisH [Acidimicrobiia bacterium]
MPTGTANLASVLAAFRRLGAGTALSHDASEVADAVCVVVPGVGSFGAAMGALDEAGMSEALVARVDAGRPTLAICVGMQLLAEKSEESPEQAGLGVIEDGLDRFGSGLRVPQMGWNQVTAGPGCRFLEDGWAYFANSYRMGSVPQGWSGATSDYGGGFVAGLERDGVLACQFHPELSGPWGSALLARWLEAVA